MDDDRKPRSSRSRVIAVVVALVVVGAAAAVVTALDHARTGGLTAGPPEDAIRITGTGYLQQQPREDIKLCIGAIMESLPPQCAATVAVAGLDWDQVPDATTHSGVTGGYATLTGLWRDEILTVETATAPVPPEDGDLDGLTQLCATPSVVAGHTSGDELNPPALEGLPGFQGLWITYPDGPPKSEADRTTTVINVAVIGDHEEVTRVVRESYQGPLCVGTIEGSTHRQLTSAMDRLMQRFQELGVLGAGPSLQGGRAVLDVTVFLATTESVARIREAVGAEVAPWTTVSGQFREVD